MALSDHKPDAADSWVEGEAVTDERFEELMDVLRAHPDYEVRPAVICKHEGSSVVKTIDTLDAAEQTLVDFRYQVMFERYPFEDLDDEQIEHLKGHEFAEDSREEVREASSEGSSPDSTEGEEVREA